ncbi:cyclopropane fatty-acyl-phospholipid synthase-like methyltransferase [Xanthomonas arboricola]|uniref:SAM-dependent methyltransferase n=1 Tax=Xanthomonas arboricola TaxID=56448 RepID=UPI00161FE0EE|nr:SAM-dependent methyltransferase [Xanthomonas arboricola]MBB6258060.1 cyclopropane fatty-acyl-phospholipid synthase-like methyltransferase [Xanthomonas arboricola]
MQRDDEDPGQAAQAGRLISHGSDDQNDAALLASLTLRLRQSGNRPDAVVQRLLGLVDALWATEFGRFLLRHRGLNAYWTHRLVTYRADAQPNESMSAMERHIFEEAPAVLATRERFGIFQQQLQELLRPGMTLASVPCGWMGELLLLDYLECPDVRLIGIDLDPQALEGALHLARARGLEGQLSLRLQDAWTSGADDHVDVLTSNGLNIYEPDEVRVIALYRAFFQRLVPGGMLVASFLTPPPTLSAESPWKLEHIDPEALMLQNLVFAKIVQARWASFRTHAQTSAQLESAGFTDLRFIDDRAGIFPTVVARRPAAR